MKALELADAYADACFDQALNGRTEDPIPEQKRDELAAELRRLAAVESDCAPYLKEGETPAERIKRALGDADSLMSLYRDVVAERDALKAENERLLAANRDCIAHYEDARAELERIKANPVHQFRKSRCADWFDGNPDHTDGGGPYETRTLYALGSKT